jgi:2-(1,2-epoxy-1,2-dihydrophenyl)acetyl-CoA isomerase
LDKPVVAAVNGVAAGAGANIALACDIVLASEAASFIQAFSAIGLIPDSGGTFFLPRLVGFQKALALAMLGDKVSAIEAEKMGMIYKAVPVEEFEKVVQTISEKLAQMPTYGLALTKKAFNESLSNNLERQLEAESRLQIEASESEDCRDGITAFVEKRKPTFKGK